MASAEKPKEISAGLAFSAFVALVIIGYGIALSGVFLGAGWNPSPWGIALSLFLGLIFILWGLRSDDLFARFDSGVGTAVLFIIPILIVLIVQIILGANGTWLLSLPIVSAAVERLRPVWRWPVYLASLLGMVLPL